MDKISPFHIKNFRKQTGLSQKAFAQAVDRLEPTVLMKQAKED